MPVLPSPPAVRVIHRVHSNATNRRTNTAPTLSTGLAEFAQAVLFIADRTDRGAAFDENAAHFTGTQTDLSVFAFTSNQLTERTGSTNELSTLAREQFDAVNRRTTGMLRSGSVLPALIGDSGPLKISWPTVMPFGAMM